MFVRWPEIDAGSAQGGVADLFLDDRQRQIEDVNVMHDVAVTERVNRKFVKGSTLAVARILPIETGEADVSSEYLAKTVLGVSFARILAGMKEVVVMSVNPCAPLSHSSLLPQHALDVVH